MTFRALIVTSTVGVPDDLVVHVMPVVPMDIVVHRISLEVVHGNNLIRLKKLLEASAVLIPSSVYTMTLQSFYFRLLIHMGFSMRMYYASILVLYMWTLIKNW